MQFEVKGKTTREKKLIQLETLLNIEIPVSGSVLLLFLFLPWQALVIAGVLIIGAALLLGAFFILAKSVLLFQLQKYGWFATLILFVVLPLFLIPFYLNESEMYPIQYIIPLVFYIFYSLFLRMVIPYWPD